MLLDVFNWAGWVSLCLSQLALSPGRRAVLADPGQALLRAGLALPGAVRGWGCAGAAVPAQPFPVPAHCSRGSRMGMVEMMAQSSAASHQMLIIVHNCPGMDPGLKWGCFVHLRFVLYSLSTYRELLLLQIRGAECPGFGFPYQC